MSFTFYLNINAKDKNIFKKRPARASITDKLYFHFGKSFCASNQNVIVIFY